MQVAGNLNQDYKPDGKVCVFWFKRVAFISLGPHRNIGSFLGHFDKKIHSLVILKYRPSYCVQVFLFVCFIC